MTASRSGLLATLAAQAFWGFIPLYFFALGDVPVHALLSHRVIWALGILVVILAATGGLVAFWRGLRNRRAALWLFASASLIAANWLFFVLAVQQNRTSEASLGYYIAPLLSVALAALVLREPVTRPQWAALGLAGAGVVVLALAKEAWPIYGLMTGLCSSLYALIRKTVAVEALPGLAIECLLLTPFGLIALALLGLGETPAIQGWEYWLWMAASGPLTAAPLFFFAYGVRRIPLALAGILSYGAPTLQFLIAALWLGEAMGMLHIAAFGLIWAAVAIFSGAQMSRAARK